MTYNTNPNQRIIIISKDVEKPYGVISRKAEQIAVHQLDDNTASYMLFIHLALNQDTHQFAFSPAALQEELGISKDRCRTAFNKLVEKGYLKPIREDSNKYVFYQIPPEYTDNNTYPCERPIPVNKDIPIDTDRVSLPTQIGYPCGAVEGICTDTDRNNINIINNNNIGRVSEIDTFAVGDCFQKIFVFDKNDTNTDTEQKSRSNRKFYISQYNKKLQEAKYCNGIADGAIITAILKKYLATHKEAPFLKRWGDKYGRIVKGWDNERKEPIVVYSHSYLQPEQMKHKIEDIPKEYYES